MTSQGVFLYVPDAVLDFSFVFGDLDHSLNASFATLMYSCYAATILAGVLSSRLQQKDGDS